MVIFNYLIIHLSQYFIKNLYCKLYKFYLNKSESKLIKNNWLLNNRTINMIGEIFVKNFLNGWVLKVDI